MHKTAISMTKKLAVLLLTAGISYSMAGWDGKSKEKPDTTTIDKKTFYLIQNEANLAWFADSVNSTKGTVNLNAKLTAPLNMRHKLFVPIAAGMGNTLFGGIFDGNGYTISNLYIDAAKIGEVENPNCDKNRANCNAQNVGFIAVLGGGTIKNLILEDIDFTASTNLGDILDKDRLISVGSVVGWQSSGTVESCFATGTIQTSGLGNVVGGIVGNMKGGTVKNNLSTVSLYVSGDNSYAGGIVGATRGEATIETNAYDGNSIVNNGDGALGGVLGYLEKGSATVSQSYFNSNIAKRGVGLISKDTTVELNGSAKGAKDLNTSEVVCALNGGKEGSCPDGVWSIGATHISLNGVSVNDNGNIVYTVNFDANKGIFSKSAKTSILLEAGEKISAAEITRPTRGDTVFAGWALTADAKAPAEDLGTVERATTVYAVWKNMLEITFDANGGAFVDSEGETTGKTTKKIVAEGSDINMEGISIGTTYGIDETTFYFVGWATEKDAEEPLETLGKATENTTFYALWREEVTYTITLDGGEGGYTVVFVNEDGKLEKPEDPEADGYTFIGWYDGDAEYDFDEVVTGDVKLEAKWEPLKYKITYEVDGGKNNKDNPDAYTIESSTIVLGAPTKEGFVFNGWFYDKKFTDRATQISRGSTGDITLYAKWELVTYEVTYMAGRYGSGIIAPDLKEHGFEMNLSKKTYERKGYIQTGWSTTDGGELAYKLGATYEKDEPLALFPYWEEDPDAIRPVAKTHLDFGATAHGRTLEIHGVPAGKVLSVFDMQGRLVSRTTATGASLLLDIAKPGIYLVRTDSQAVKVNIR